MPGRATRNTLDVGALIRDHVVGRCKLNPEATAHIFLGFACTVPVTEIIKLNPPKVLERTRNVHVCKPLVETR